LGKQQPFSIGLASKTCDEISGPKRKVFQPIKNFCIFFPNSERCTENGVQFWASQRFCGGFSSSDPTST
jgi:hypothetical protein